MRTPPPAFLVAAIVMAILASTCGRPPVSVRTSPATTPQASSPGSVYSLPEATPSSGGTASESRVSSPARTETCLDQMPAPTWQVTPADRNLALVTLTGSQSFVVRDVTNIDNAFTVAPVPDLGRMKFVSGADLSGNEFSRVVFSPISGQPATVTASGCGNIFDFAWNGDGAKFIYVTNDDIRPVQELRQVGAGVDRVIAIVGKPIPVTGCVACSDNAEVRLAYSPDGRYISLVGWGTFEVWRSDGALISGVDVGGQRPTMSVWSGSTLYFRNDEGVQMWRDGVVSTVLAGVAWIHPKASPSGGQVIYVARDVSGQAHLFVLDTGTNKTASLVNAERMEPAYLTPRYVWYAGEVVCPQTASGSRWSDGCYPTGYQWPTLTKPTGITYIYDLQQRVEVQSKIASVLDVWPHGR